VYSILKGHITWYLEEAQYTVLHSVKILQYYIVDSFSLIVIFEEYYRKVISYII